MKVTAAIGQVELTLNQAGQPLAVASISGISSTVDIFSNLSIKLQGAMSSLRLRDCTVEGKMWSEVVKVSVCLCMQAHTQSNWIVVCGALMLFCKIALIFLFLRIDSRSVRRQIRCGVSLSHLRASTEGLRRRFPVACESARDSTAASIRADYASLL